MSGVGITGKIKPKDGGSFPVFEDIDGQGGYRTVADIAARDAIPIDFKHEGMQTYVQHTKCIYALESDLSTWQLIANVNLGAQANWFINPDNSTGLASNSNDGLTALTPILDWAEYANRCFPSGARLLLKVSTLTVTIIAATPQTIENMYMSYGRDPSLSSFSTVNVTGALSSTAAMTLTSVTKIDAAADIRGQLTTSSGTFVDGQKIRITSGAAIGGVCYSMGLVSPTNTYNSLPAVDFISIGVYPDIGDTVVVDTLLMSVNRLEVWAGARVVVNVFDLKITRAVLYGGTSAPYTGGGGSISLLNCVATSTGGQWQAAFGANFLNCNVEPTSKTAFVGSQILFLNQNVRGVMSLGQGSFVVYGMWINGGNLVIGNSDNYNHFGMSAQAKAYFAAPQVLAQSAGSVEVENGPGPLGAGFAAITITPGSVVQNDGFQSEMWGVSGGYPIALQMYALSWLYFPGTITADPISRFLKIAATIALRICSQDFAYSANPVMFRTLAGGIIAEVIAPNSPETETYVSRPALTAAVGVTPLAGVGAARKGTYRVWGYLSPTIAGAAGSLTLNAIYTDESGATITKPVCSIDNTVLSGSGGSIEVECNGASAVSYSVTGYSAGLTYNVRVATEYDNAGP